jgi:hypothetical protein
MAASFSPDNLLLLPLVTNYPKVDFGQFSTSAVFSQSKSVQSTPTRELQRPCRVNHYPRPDAVDKTKTPEIGGSNANNS